MYSFGFVVLARMKAVLIPGIFTPSSRHFMATMACNLSPRWNCSLIMPRTSMFSREVKRATLIPSSLPRILITASICRTSSSSAEDFSLYSSVTFVAPQYTRMLLSFLYGVICCRNASSFSPAPATSRARSKARISPRLFSLYLPFFSLIRHFDISYDNSS